MIKTILISIILFIVGFIIGKLSKKVGYKCKTKKLDPSIIKQLLDYRGGTLTIKTIFSDDTFKIAKYSGSCTVWYELPSFKRCPSWLESSLFDKVEAYRYMKAGNTLDGYELLNK